MFFCGTTRTEQPRTITQTWGPLNSSSTRRSVFVGYGIRVAGLGVGGDPPGAL